MLGIYIGQAMKNRIRELKEVERILGFLQGEIRYKYSILSEAFLNISDKFGQPFRKWLEGLSTVLDTQNNVDKASVDIVDGFSVDRIWHISLVMLREETSLKEKDLEKIDQVGKCLGYLDIESQLNGIDFEKENIHGAIEDLEKGIEQRVKLSVTLGLLGGILMVLIML